MNQKHYLYVSTLARERSFSRASEVLGIAQPTLSQCIKKLEREMGAELFVRNGSDVHLSEAGERYLQYGMEILAVEKKMRDAFDAIRAYKTGTLKIALSPSKCYTLMPDVIRRFRERYPGIRVQIEERLAGELLRGIDDEEYELGVTPMPQDGTRYDCDVVFTEEIILAVPKTMPVFERLREVACSRDGCAYPAVDFSLLGGADFIVMQDWQVMQKQLTDLCDTCGIEICPVVECTNNLTMITMTQSGVGCSLIPSSTVPFSESMNNDNIAYFSLQQHVSRRKIVCIRKKGKKIAEPAKFMLALLTEMR